MVTEEGELFEVKLAVFSEAEGGLSVGGDEGRYLIGDKAVRILGNFAFEAVDGDVADWGEVRGSDGEEAAVERYLLVGG